MILLGWFNENSDLRRIFFVGTILFNRVAFDFFEVLVKFRANFLCILECHTVEANDVKRTLSMAPRLCR